MNMNTRFYPIIVLDYDWTVEEAEAWTLFQEDFWDTTAQEDLLDRLAVKFSNTALTYSL